MSITNFSSLRHLFFFSFFFFNDPAPTEIYTLSLHDALPISMRDIGAEALVVLEPRSHRHAQRPLGCRNHLQIGDRKSTRLNSSHQIISYAVFCLKKKKKKKNKQLIQLTSKQTIRQSSTDYTC